jgi:putative phosphoribosyl transferase
MFPNRIEAGRILANQFPKKYITSNSLVIGIGLKGIPVACSFASELNLPVDFVIAKKIPLMGKPYVAIGAVTSDGTCEFDELMLKKTGMRQSQLDNYVKSVVEDLRSELIRLRGTYMPPDMHGKTIIIVDDGVASGHTLQAVIKCVKKQMPEKIIAAVPGSSFFGYQRTKDKVDDFIALKICSDPTFSIDSLYNEERNDHEMAKQCIETVRMLGLAQYAKNS